MDIQRANHLAILPVVDRQALGVGKQYLISVRSHTVGYLLKRENLITVPAD